jgi:hypothetical protein
MSLWRRRGSNEPSSLFVGEQLRLLRGDSSAVKFIKAQLPFVYQLSSLSRSPLGAGKHPLCMDALLRRSVQWLAGGIIRHMIPNPHGKTYKRILYKLVERRGRCLPLRAGARLNRVRLSFSGRFG